jgi:hypothetical protein
VRASGAVGDDTVRPSFFFLSISTPVSVISFGPSCALRLRRCSPWSRGLYCLSIRPVHRLVHCHEACWGRLGVSSGVAFIYCNEARPLVSMNRASQRPTTVPASSSGVINDIFHTVARSCGAQLAFLVFPWNNSFDHPHVSFTFIHATLVTQSPLGLHP